MDIHSSSSNIRNTTISKMNEQQQHQYQQPQYSTDGGGNAQSLDSYLLI
jgi:hypothetical protein